MRIRPLYWLLLTFMSACVPSSPPPPPEGWVEVPTPAPAYDAGDRDGLGTALGNACAKLRAFSCVEGTPLPTGQTCYEHLTALSAFFIVPAECVNASATVGAVRACGTTATLRFRCPS